MFLEHLKLRTLSSIYTVDGKVILPIMVSVSLPLIIDHICRLDVWSKVALSRIPCLVCGGVQAHL